MPAAASAVVALVFAKRSRNRLAFAALLGDRVGRVVGAEELPVVVFVERDQTGDSPSHAGVAGERGVFGARQVEANLGLEGRAQSNGTTSCSEKERSGHHTAFCEATLIP
jgi:hypothetical protein